MSHQATHPTIPVLTHPQDGPADLVNTTVSYQAALRRLDRGHGPFAVDAERASGYRYGDRNYLIQVRREGAGTFLIDPTAVDDFSELNAVMAADTWIFHAAIQDLGPLRDQGLTPGTIFDTEVAARLLGLDRVNLAAVTAHFLGVTLEKQHSHQDWSTRPLPSSWLTYAALDVELLGDLAISETDALTETRKLRWAHEEFAYIQAQRAIHRPDPGGAPRGSNVSPTAAGSQLSNICGTNAKKSHVRKTWPLHASCQTGASSKQQSHCLAQ